MHSRLELENERTPSFTRGRGDTDTAKPWLWAAALMALAGTMFAGMSTADFIEHLDRQVHSIHCSFIPGAGQQLGESGCRTVMMSPYSSLFRTSLWGGLPISLLALAVFSYLIFRAVDFALRSDRSRRETGFLVLAWLLPVLMSAIYGYIAMAKLGATCKLCVGVYASSLLGFACALIAHSRQEPSEVPRPSGSDVIRWFGEGAIYVAIIAGVYLFGAPQTAKSAEGCGHLVKREDPAGMMVDLGGRGAKSIAVLDPLCSACRAFDQRLEASGLREQLSLSVVLFPLDQSCNWMVKSSLHPGACAVSEAILCRPERARQIIDWAFADQEGLIADAKVDDKKIRDRIGQQFPDVKACLGSAKVKNKLNKSLRWAVANALPVLTPQLFIGDRRVCDEDTDLGLEFTIAAMIQQGGAR